MAADRLGFGLVHGGLGVGFAVLRFVFLLVLRMRSGRRLGVGLRGSGLGEVRR